MTILEVADVPPSPNVLRRKYRNPHAYRKLRTHWEWLLLTAPDAHRRKVLKDGARKAGKVAVQITLHHSRMYDPDNLPASLKPVLDALVNIGFLSGDSLDKINLLPTVQTKCPRKEIKTVVKIGVAE